MFGDLFSGSFVSRTLHNLFRSEVPRNFGKRMGFANAFENQGVSLLSDRWFLWESRSLSLRNPLQQNKFVNIRNDFYKCDEFHKDQ